MKPTAILLIHCPDQKGIVASVTRFLHENDGNVVYLDEHVDKEEKVFFMRIEWELNGFRLGRDAIDAAFKTAIAEPFEMRWRLAFSDQSLRMAVMVSKLPHCLFDVLSRVESREWQVTIPFVLSNHEDLKSVAGKFGIPFHVFPVDDGDKEEQEKKQLALLQSNRIDFIVLARYMRILSPAFVDRYPNRIINIHHSFLPAFPGSNPYGSAHARGVKIIGATGHYVTAELDQGPIIEQDVARVSHIDSVEDMMRKGRDLEKVVFSRAIWNHLQHKLLVYKNRTIVFS